MHNFNSKTVSVTKENSPYRELVESDKYCQLDSSSQNTMYLLLEQADREQDRIMNEATTSQDIARYTPILMPLIRMVYPRLIANELLGVQPLSSPTGYIYTFNSEYRAKPKDERVKLVLYKLDRTPTEDKDDDIDGETVVYKEGNYLLVTTKNARKKANEPFGTYTVKEVYSNVTQLPKILKNFSEANLSDEMRPQINYMGFTVNKKPVEAIPRALHTEYSLELYQDLASQFGALADEEMTNVLSHEIQSDIDAHVVRFVNQTARQLPDWDAATYYARGLTSVQVARELAMKIADESAQIAKQTNRGRANVILCSPKVANRLSALDGFVQGPVSSDISKMSVTTGFVGTLDGTLRVVVDPYTSDEYVTVLYKGTDRFDAMGFFCPYTPLTFVRTLNSQTGMNGIIAKTRYALTTIPGFEDPLSTDRASLYATTFSVVNL